MGNKQRTCGKCGRWRNEYGEGLCRSCFNKKFGSKENVGFCEMCNEKTNVKKSPFCSKCHKKLYVVVDKCGDCGEIKRIRAKGLCSFCYIKNK